MYCLGYQGTYIYIQQSLDNHHGLLFSSTYLVFEWCLLKSIWCTLSLCLDKASEGAIAPAGDDDICWDSGWSSGNYSAYTEYSVMEPRLERKWGQLSHLGLPREEDQPCSSHIKLRWLPWRSTGRYYMHVKVELCQLHPFSLSHIFTTAQSSTIAAAFLSKIWWRSQVGLAHLIIRILFPGASD